MALLFKKPLCPGLALCVLLTGCTTLTPTSSTQQTISTIETAQSLTKVKTIADDLAREYGANNVLIVFDVDDTLLSGTTDLGATAWWNWQSDLAETSPGYMSFPKRLATNGVMYALSDMVPTEGQTTINIFSDLIKDGFAVHGLTARRPDNRDATLRELHDQGLDFTTAPECGAPLCIKRGQLNGDTLIAPLARKRFGFESGASTHDMGAGSIKLSSQRNASVSDGLMMVSGQNKGIMLRLLVDSFPKSKRPKAIIFVDDSTRNITDVQATSPAYSENLRIIHYQAHTADQVDFINNQARQDQTINDLKDISETVCLTLNNLAQVCDR